MRIFRYLFKEVMTNFLAVSIVLFLIFVSGRFVKYLAQAAAGQFSSEVLFSIMLFRLPGFMELIFPLALFLSIMMAYGRLYVESEMVVLQACGMSKKRLLVYTQGPALIVMLLVTSFTTYLTPLGWKNFQDIWNDPKTYSGLSTIVAGSFKKLGSQGAVIYTSEINSEKTVLKDVFIVSSEETRAKKKKKKQKGKEQSLEQNKQDEHDHEIRLVKASSAEVISNGPNERFIELHDGKEYTGVPGELDYRISRFEKYGQRLQESSEKLAIESSVDAIPTSILMSGQTDEEVAAFYWRIFMPFMVPIAAIIALALSETNHRKGRYIKLLPGIIIFILYIAALIGIRTEIEKGKVPAIAGYWIIHFVFLSIGLFIYYFDELKSSIRLPGKNTDNAVDSSV